MVEKQNVNHVIEAEIKTLPDFDPYPSLPLPVRSKCRKNTYFIEAICSIVMCQAEKTCRGITKMPFAARRSLKLFFRYNHVKNCSFTVISAPARDRNEDPMELL